MTLQRLAQQCAHWAGCTKDITSVKKTPPSGVATGGKFNYLLLASGLFALILGAPFEYLYGLITGIFMLLGWRSVPWKEGFPHHGHILFPLLAPPVWLYELGQDGLRQGVRKLSKARP